MTGVMHLFSVLKFILVIIEAVVLGQRMMQVSPQCFRNSYRSSSFGSVMKLHIGLCGLDRCGVVEFA
jgi:hypothetical protein